uniref:SAP domain-containing protein n=1 Tax=Rhizophora mucronata TaxID=61149 RepID=A0A2P2MTG2_RHIMU
MSSRYPILDNRPIDQWKVTELKEELKRRKLTIKGLKDDLIKRLDEALRIERENAIKEADNGPHLDSQPAIDEKKADTMSIASQAAQDVLVDVANKSEKVDHLTVQIDINSGVETIGEGELQEGTIVATNSSSVEKLTVNATSIDTSIATTESVVPEVVLGGHDGLNPRKQEVGVNSSMQTESEDLNPQLENEVSKAQLEIETPMPQLENEDSKSQLEIGDLKPHNDVLLDSSAPENQVPEVSPNLGFQVKSDSISTDSVSINDMIELKDNIIADNVKLELDVVKPEIVEPLSSVGGESHPMDVKQPQERKPSVEEKDDSNATNADVSKKNDSVEMGYSEKLNLDRSSGDDSMEYDVLESKQVDSKYDADEVGDRTEKDEVTAVKQENLVDIVGNELPAQRKEKHSKDKICTAVPSEKRKLNDQEAAVTTEPLKRQRRWNSEGLKSSEAQSSNLTPTTTTRDAPQPSLRHFSRSNSSVTEDAPKERTVPPSQKPPTDSLRIDHFLRPFTLKAVQELLGKTGTVTSFWMDHIKTHCYVTYSSVEEAIETRNAVYNLQWPPNGGRLLVAEFVDQQEVKMRLEAPPQSPATPVTRAAAATPALQPQPSPTKHVSRQHLPPETPLPPPPPLSSPPLAKERLPHPPPPPLPEKQDPPIVTLDDLFRKTKAAPRIYYLPLSEEQVAAKRAEQGKKPGSRD